MEEKTEEILFVNSLKKDCILLNRNSLPEQNCLYTPHSLAIKIPSNNVHNKAQSRRANKALVIGEMPFELDEMDNLNNSINSSSNQNMVKSNSNLKSKKWSIRESSDFSLNYIDSPEAAAVPVVYNKAALIPYLILPLNNRSNSNNDNEIDDEKEEASSSKNKTNNENENLDKKEEGDNHDNEQNDEKKSELENKKEPVIEREHWDHKIEFLLAIIGFSVDLGNIWRCNFFFIILV